MVGAVNRDGEVLLDPMREEVLFCSHFHRLYDLTGDHTLNFFIPS
jgi:hypothetical protein